jgi:hypothetical protein
MMTVLLIVALLLAALQPTLVMFDFLKETHTYITQINFWHITLFATDGSMMLLMVIPGIVLWFCNRNFFEDLHHVSLIETMEKHKYQVWIQTHLFRNYRVLLIAMVSYIAIIFFLPLLRSDGLTSIGVQSLNDLVAIVWFTGSTLLAGVSIINVWMLISRKRWLFPVTIFTTLFGVYIGTALIFECSMWMMIGIDNLILENLVGMPIDRIFDYGITSYLVIPTMLFINILFFWLSYDLVQKKFSSPSVHIHALREPAK